MKNDEARLLWNDDKITQPEFEVNCLFNMCLKHRKMFPDTEANFETLFESIILKLIDFEDLSEHEWESIQRLYYIHVGTFLTEDIAEALGYDLYDQEEEE